MLAFPDGGSRSAANHGAKVAIVAFMTRTSCDWDWVAWVLHTLRQDLGDDVVSSTLVIIDTLPGEKLTAVTHEFKYQLATCSRRAVADYLGVSMSGFRVPHLVLYDSEGEPYSAAQNREQFCANFAVNCRDALMTLINRGNSETEVKEQVLTTGGGQ